MRLIDADRLNDAMYHEAFETDSEMQKWDSGCWIRYKMFENHLEEAPTIEQPTWIPCSERLPREEDQDDELGVLVTLGNGYSGLQYDYYFNGLWDDWNGYVIAWMPLPAPWEGADNE